MMRSMSSEEELLEVEKATERLQKALRLQYRSALQYVLAAGSLSGFEYQPIGEQLGRFASAELTDARHLVEKVSSLGAVATTEVAPLVMEPDPKRFIAHLIELEDECANALQEAIEPTGREARSEALEHRLEHIIMRKQEQIDTLRRALGNPQPT